MTELCVQGRRWFSRYNMFDAIIIVDRYNTLYHTTSFIPFAATMQCVAVLHGTNSATM